MSAARLPLRKQLAWYVHSFKALKQQRHKEMLPLLEDHVPKDGIIIDVGASEGQFTKLFAQIVPQGHVYAFEPGSYARSIVSKVIVTKQLKNVSLFPVGLSDRDAIETLSGNSGGGCPVMNTGKTDEEKITLTTLDRFASLHNIQKLDLIRAATGGREMSFLHGAEQTIRKFKPALLIESHGSTATEMWDFLKALNYRIDRLEDVGKSPTSLSAPLNGGFIWCVAEDSRKNP